MLAAIRAVNHLEMLGETLRSAVNALAVAFPQWLADGMRLLEAVFSPQAPHEVQLLGAVELLRQVWVQNFQVVDGVVRERDAKNVPPARLRPFSPYDLDVRAGAKRGASWTGCLVQLTETCEPDAPHLITHVATTDASVSDLKMIDAIHAGLPAHGRLPAVHLVDANYIDAQGLADAEQAGIKLVGPIKQDTSTQSSGGFAADAFVVDWESKQVTCPNGRVADAWYPRVSSRGIPVIRVRFSRNWLPRLPGCGRLRAVESRPRSGNHAAGESRTRSHEEEPDRPEEA
ncbi:hypothetical protein ACFTY8_09855 [Streptomyces mirabilis]|uniref:hypothetical protein n=1 Tax=Streptomyces mirabilis TaxID=68239 RepID=UPI0036377A9A